MNSTRHQKTGCEKVVSVVIGSFNRCRFLKLAIASVREELKRFSLPAEIIVVDGGSTDGALGWLLKQKDILTIVQHNRGEWTGRPIDRRSWGYFMNLGFKCAQGNYICMLSDDCLVVPGAIKNGIELFDARLAVGEKTGALAFYWRNWPEQQKYWVGFTFGNRMFVNHGLFLRQALEEVGYVDEENYSFYHADGDLCLRMSEYDYSCIDSPESFVEHHTHANMLLRKENLVGQHADWKRYCERWQHLGPPDQDWREIAFDDPAKTAGLFRKGWLRW